MQYFYINQGSVLPRLQMELITDGRYSFNHFNEAIQNADITFTMTDLNTGVVKIANRECYLVKKPNTSCVDEYLICLDWRERDTVKRGEYKGVFTIKFNEFKNDQDSLTSPSGDLIMPIREDLMIVIK